MNMTLRPFHLCLSALALVSLTCSAFAYDPPPASKAAVAKIDFSTAVKLDANYASQFTTCDSTDVFRGIALKGWRKCSGDPNRLKALLKFPDGTIFFEAKMALDIDGSWKACNSPGLADLCPTWYNWPGKTGKAAFLDSDVYPFIVIPIAGPKAHRAEFKEKTGIKAGDFAVVIYDGNVVPAIVGDGGPFNKIGEASNAVFAAVGKDRCRNKDAGGHCTKYKDASVESGVLYFVFPGTASTSITPDNAIQMMKEIGLERFKALVSP